MARTVLVPIDGSEQSWEALDFAIDLFEEATITVIHVIRWVPEYYDSPHREHVMEDAEDLIGEAQEQAKQAGVNTTTNFESEIETGPPAKMIIEYSETYGVDHVVMGSRGRTGIKRLLLGSVAETVARRSPAPVTIIRQAS